MKKTKERSTRKTGRKTAEAEILTNALPVSVST